MQQQLNKIDYSYPFEKSPNKKGTCPKCKQHNKYRYYEGLPREFGKCERVNECSFENAPTKEKLKELHHAYTPTVEKTKTVGYPNEKQLKCLTHTMSVFHKFCTDKLKIPLEHLQKWNVGTDAKGNTAFVLQTLAGKHLNIKYMSYKLSVNGNDCKRDKAINFYLKADVNEVYKTCLLGEHLLNNDRIICLVESEKTAVISSFFYQQYDWLATGGSNGLTVDKVQILKGKEVYYLADNDKAGQENSTLKKLETYGINFKKVHFETAKSGEDLADLIIRGERPDIKPNIVDVATTSNNSATTTSNNKPVKEQQQEKVKNGFIILKEYMLTTWQFQYNVIRNEIEYKLSTDTEYILLNDADVYIHLKENNVYFKKDDFTALLRSSTVQPYNPIEKYFESLPKWDMQLDHIEKLISYLEYSGTIDIKVHFKKWIVRAVKCAIDDNYFNKQIFVLIGKQNDGKSTFVRFLVPFELEKYYMENPDFKNKDGEIALTQNFIINMDELANIGKEDNDKLKTFISKVSTNIRRPYEKNTRPEPRKASFMGTTNNDEFLTDHTGNVRWLNFRIDSINFNYSKDVKVNDVWAQAYYLFLNGFDCEISKEELIEVENNNQDFKIMTEEMAVIREHFVKPYLQDAARYEFMTSTQIKTHLESLNPNYRNLNIGKIGRAMMSLGFKKESKRTPDYPDGVKGYYLYKK